MILFRSIMVISFAVDRFVDCGKDFQSHKQTKYQTSLQRLSNLHRWDNLAFCSIGCVLNDPKNRPRIDDPGRNIYDSFSVISTSYVVEVIGSNDELVGHPLRVMVSEQTLRKGYKTFIKLQHLSLYNGELIQRITFNLKTEFTVTRYSGKSRQFTVRIPHVVPHVILVYDYTSELRETRAEGVVIIEISDYPRTLEVEVVRDDRSCWIKSVDEQDFKNYLISVKVRGENRKIIGTVSSTVQEKLIEDGFPFETYMSQINEFAVRFLREAILQETKVIKKNKILNELCDTISHQLLGSNFNSDSSSDEDSREDSSSCEDETCQDTCEYERCKCKEVPCYKNGNRRQTIRINIKEFKGRRRTNAVFMNKKNWNMNKNNIFSQTMNINN